MLGMLMDAALNTVTFSPLQLHKELLRMEQAVELSRHHIMLLEQRRQVMENDLVTFNATIVHCTVVALLAQAALAAGAVFLFEFSSGNRPVGDVLAQLGAALACLATTATTFATIALPYEPEFSPDVQAALRLLEGTMRDTSASPLQSRVATYQPSLASSSAHSDRVKDACGSTRTVAIRPVDAMHLPSSQSMC
jgi:hypothetical protein